MPLTVQVRRLFCESGAMVSDTGGKTCSKESMLDFLSKDKNKKAFDYLKKGDKVGEVAKITDLHINTISKIKKLVNQ